MADTATTLDQQPQALDLGGTTTTPEATAATTADSGTTQTVPLPPATESPQLTTGALSLPYTQKSEELKQEAQKPVSTQYDTYQPTAESPATPKGETFLTPETSVAQQLSNILSKESPLSKLVTSKAQEQANALGMLSSSAGIGAAQRALIESALPIAQQDAKTAAGFKMAEQTLANEQVKIDKEAQVSGDLTVQKAKIAEQQKRMDESFTMSLKGLDADTESAMLEQKAQWDMKFKELDAEVTRELQQQEIDANVEQKIMNQTHDMMNQYQISIQQLLGNQAFLESFDNREDMNKIFNEMMVSTTAAIRFNAKAAGVYDEGFQGYLTDLKDFAAW